MGPPTHIQSSDCLIGAPFANGRNALPEGPDGDVRRYPEDPAISERKREPNTAVSHVTRQDAFFLLFATEDMLRFHETPLLCRLFNAN
jgi:hypothetical protein